MGLSFPEVRLYSATRSLVAVGVADGVFLALNNNRVGLILTAANAVRYTITSAGVAVLDQGITIPAAGATVILNWPESHPFTKLALRAIASGAVSVEVYEIIR